MNLKAKAAILVSIFLVAAISWMVYNNPAKINNSYNDFGSNIPQSYPILGIDVSHYQGDINWEQVSLMNVNGDSIQFAFIKATEALTVKDDQLAKNVAGASKNTIECGVYHYFFPDLSAIQQADFFVDEAFPHNYTLLPVLDVEVTNDMSAESLRDSVKVFLDRVEERINQRPIIYTYANFYDLNFKADLPFAGEIYWIAQYAASCKAMSSPSVLAWQFSESGTVDGINEAVDLNIAKEGFLEKVRVKK